MKKPLVFLLLVGGVAGLLFFASPGLLPPSLSRLVAKMTGSSDLPITRSVVVTTDKQTYTSDESINITLKNPTSDSILTHLGSFTPIVGIERVEQKSDIGSWKRLSARCLYPYCTYKEDSPIELPPGRSQSFDWKPIIFLNGTLEQYRLSPGTYRVLIRVRARASLASSESVWQAAVSNEFTIR